MLKTPTKDGDKMSYLTNSLIDDNRLKISPKKFERLKHPAPSNTGNLHFQRRPLDGTQLH